MPITTAFTNNTVLNASSLNALPWGLVATTSGGTNSLSYKNGIANFSTTAGTTADVTGCSMTFTGIAGRLYRYQASGQGDSTSASGISAILITDGSNVVKQRSYLNASNTAGAGSFIVTYIFTATGSTTLKLRLNAITGTCGIFAADSLGGIVIEDIGPSA
jgi:hypothetical protein